MCFPNYLGIDFQVQLPHPRDNGLLALLIKVDPEGGIFPGEAPQAFGEFIQVILKHKPRFTQQPLITPRKKASSFPSHAEHFCSLGDFVEDL